MKRLDLARVRPGDLKDPVATIGVFDGVHRGHRQLLYELALWARAIGGESCVLTFDRHPLAVLRGERVPPLLTLENRHLGLERPRRTFPREFRRDPRRQRSRRPGNQPSHRLRGAGR